MKKQRVLLVLIVVLSVLLFLTVGAIVYLVYKGNTTPVATQVTSSLSSSTESLKYNYVNLSDYKDKVKIRTVNDYTLYYTNLKFHTAKETKYISGYSYDILLQNGSLENAVLLKGAYADDGSHEDVGEISVVLETNIDKFSEDGKYVTLTYPTQTAIAGSSVYVFSLETGKYLGPVKNYYGMGSEEEKNSYFFYGDYVVSFEQDLNAGWDTGNEVGPSKIVVINLNDFTSKDLVYPSTPYSKLVLVSVSEDGLLTYSIEKYSNEKDYNGSKFTSETKTLDLNTVLNK